MVSMLTFCITLREEIMQYKINIVAITYRNLKSMTNSFVPTVSTLSRIINEISSFLKFN